MYLRATQGHSGNNLVDPTLQDNVLLLEDFTEYIYHVGNVSEIYSIINSGLTPGGKSLKGERQSVFFTAVSPMEDDQSMEETRCNLDKPRLAPYKEYCDASSKHSVLVRFKARSEERVAVLSITITRNRSLQHTTCDLCEKAVCMKTNEEQNYRVCQPERFPCTMLKQNSQSGPQDQLDQEARTSSAHQSASGSCVKPAAATSTTEYQAYLILTVQQQDTNRRETVKKLTQQFENHPHKESFLQDLNKTEEIMRSARSKRS